MLECTKDEEKEWNTLNCHLNYKCEKLILKMPSIRMDFFPLNHLTFHTYPTKRDKAKRIERIHMKRKK